MANADIYGILAQAANLRVQQASAESGAYDNPTLGARVLSLEEASAPMRDQSIGRALSTPQSPADPRWARRLPPPPCEACAMDHRGNRVYDHQYVHPRDADAAREYIEAHGDALPSNITQMPTQGARGGVEREIVNRIAIYDSRTGYVVKVEAPPEWDDVRKVKMDRPTLTALLPLLAALGVRVKNNSEDEFDEPEHGQPTQPASARPESGANRSEADVAREWQELLPGTTPPSLEPVDADGAKRQDSDRPDAATPRRGRARKAS